ncbi:MAG: hypothetical protein R3E56_18275 [Burkholderiaceae bacterium]
MRSQVKVFWSETSTYLIDLEEVQPMPHEQARIWLDQKSSPSSNAIPSGSVARS